MPPPVPRAATSSRHHRPLAALTRRAVQPMVGVIGHAPQVAGDSLFTLLSLFGVIHDTVTGALKATALIGANAIPIHDKGGQGHNLKAYGGAGDGTTDDTVAVAAAFAAALVSGLPVIVPDGVFLTSTVEWQGQSIEGEGMAASILLGKPGQDVLHVDPSVGQFDRPDGFVRNLGIRVNDSVDATASFSDRDDVGNAGIAVDFADGEGDTPLMFIGWSFENVLIDSVSFVVGGQNASVGIYTQFQSFNLSSFRNVRFYRLANGIFDDYPRTNLTSVELARDHCHYDSLYINNCGLSWRAVNHGANHVSNLVIHSGVTGLQMVGVQSAFRNHCDEDTFFRVYLEDLDTPLDIPGARRCRFTHMFIDKNTSGALVWAASESTLESVTVAVSGDEPPYLQITGDRNTGLIYVADPGDAAFATDVIVDEGVDNRIQVGGYYSGAGLTSKAREWVTLDTRVLHSRDVLPAILGHYNPLPVSGSDWLIHPTNITPDAMTEGVGYSYDLDADADFGVALHIASPGAWSRAGDNGINGAHGFAVGKFLPATKIRVYVRAKADGAGNQFWTMNAGGVDKGTGSLTWSTTYSTQYWDIDLTGVSAATTLQIITSSTLNNDALDIAWILFRPFAADVLAAGPVRAGQYATGSRPSAATVGAGAMVFDTTLGQPIWSDGTNWVDATGSTV